MRPVKEAVIAGIPNVIEMGQNVCKKARMRRVTAFIIFICALLISAWALNFATAQNQEEPSLLGGIIIEAIPDPPTDLAVTSVSDNQITLSWKDNSAGETKFKIWRAEFSGGLYLLTEVGPNVTAYTDSGLESGTTYSYLVQACNSDGCSDSNQVSATTSGDSDEHVFINCFIATAVYRDAFHPDVQSLRKFRDEYLMTNRAGRAFVALYYRYSPPVADFVASHELLRAPLRAAFVPVAAAARHPLLALFVFSVMITGGAVIMNRRRKM